jgi:hypothetical protein
MDLINNQEVTNVPTKIKYYIREYNDGEIILPEWQRSDGWDSIKDAGPKEYKMCFIKALISKYEIPKFYLYKVFDNKNHILDGGHRTRTIDEFMKGEFGVKLNDNNYYWYILDDPKPRDKSVSQNLILPPILKEHFDNLTIDIVTYFKISDKGVRDIFNELNHHRPMTPAEVINSWLSPLVDNMRDLSTKLYNGISYIDMIKVTMNVSKSDMHEYMKTFTALFSLIERKNTDKFDYCEPKNALRYIQSNGPIDDNPNEPDTQFTDEQLEPLWKNFIESCDRYFKLIYQLKQFNGIGDKWCPLASESYSYFHFINTKIRSHTIESIFQRLSIFVRDYIHYKVNITTHNKCLKNGDKKTKEDVDEARESVNILNSVTDKNVIKWSETFTNNGAGPKNMKNRYEILVEYFNLIN